MQAFVSMDKYVVKIDAPQKQGAPPIALRGQQTRLRDCKKVVVLPNSHICADKEDIVRLRQRLQAKDACNAEIKQALRTLDCYSLSTELLIETKVIMTVSTALFIIGVLVLHLGPSESASCLAWAPFLGQNSAMVASAVRKLVPKPPISRAHRTSAL